MTSDDVDVHTVLTQELSPVIAAADLLLEELTLTGPPKHRVVRVIVDLIDGPGGVDSDHLTEVSRDISTALDALDDRLPGTYTLEVTTPGVDRVLTTARHFRRAQGRLVTIATESGRVSGRVRDASDATVTLDGRRGQVEVPIVEITSGRIDIELRPAENDA